VDEFTIRNSDGKAHGVKTMVEVLDESLNTGAIFAVQEAGAERFQKYVDRFGFGKLIGIELAGEVNGDISSLGRAGEVFSYTASYGQGITVTPIQLVTAFSAIARGGTIVKPTLIKHIRHDDGRL